MRKIVFTEDFATKKAGEEWSCDGSLASQLVHGDKVARYAEEPLLHTITEGDLELNPGLQEEVSVGEVVELGPQLTAEEVAQLEAKEGAEEKEVIEEAPASTPEPLAEAPAAPAKSKKKGKQS